jgi:hypothetical protein
MDGIASCFYFKNKKIMKNFVINEFGKKCSFRDINKTMKENFILTVILFMTTFFGYSQNSKLINVDDLLKGKLTNEVKITDRETLVKIKSFVSDLKPSVYIYNQIVDLKSDKPVCLYSDIKSINAIKSLKFPTNSIEFVSIKVKSRKDFNMPVDLNVFDGFVKLKYILFVFEYDVNPADLPKVVIDEDELHFVLYKVEIPS